jgi:hypothetical protein
LCDVTYTSWDMTTISETSHMIVVGYVKAQDLKTKLAESGQSHLE